MTKIFNALTVQFPTAKGMSKRIKTIRSEINGTIEYEHITGSSVNLIIEENFHTKRFAKEVVKELSKTFPHATIWFSNSANYIGTRRKFDSSLL